MKTRKCIELSVFLIFILGVPDTIYGRCDGSPDLSARVVRFEVPQVSPLEALLRFGKEYDLCFGVEYVDGSLVRRKSDFTIQNTTIKGAIETILGSSVPAKIEVDNGVIEILPRVAPKEKAERTRGKRLYQRYRNGRITCLRPEVNALVEIGQFHPLLSPIPWVS